MTEFLLQSSIWILWYGLIGAVLTLPWSLGLLKRTGSRPAAYLNIGMTLVGFVHSLLIVQVVWGQPVEKLVVPWLDVFDLRLDLALVLSPTSLSAVALITGLSAVAQLYALGYLEKDWSLARFYGLMGFFEAAMIGIVLSDSLFFSYALLEMLTLSTYLLVGFWYAQPLVVTAARDAFWTKRVGDLLLLMGVVTLSSLSGEFDFDRLALWAATTDTSPQVLNWLGVALIAGPVGKCAQFPLNLWLDEAMEGPNPASILRNSVVVGCGAYILIQLQPVIALSPLAQTTLVVLGTITTIGAALVAIAQIDVKRIFAHSTSSYLGLVFIAVGLQQVNLALLLLLVHAVSKALLFMTVGSLILTTNTQNVLEMGGLGARMPATATSYVIGAAGLIGLFPLGGLIVKADWLDTFAAQPWVILVMIASNSLLAFNLVRTFGLVFMGTAQPKTRRAPEVAWPMAVPMVSVSIVTLLLPFMLQRLHPLQYFAADTVWVLTLMGASGLSCGLGWLIYISPGWRSTEAVVWQPLQDLLADDFGMSKVYEMTVGLVVAQGSRLAAWFDRFVVDGVVNFVGIATLLSGESLKYNTSGRYQFYILTVLGGVLLITLLVNWSITM